MKQMMGELCRRNPTSVSASASQTIPAGWVMELIAKGTSPQNREDHGTAVEFVMVLFWCNMVLLMIWYNIMDADVGGIQVYQ